jgi:hypothetical protein
MSTYLSGLLISLSAHLAGSPYDDLGGRRRDERGDVPGWVMVTVMSAAVVAVLLPFASEELRGLLGSALDMVRQ